MTNRKKLIIFNSLLVIALLVCMTGLVWAPTVAEADGSDPIPYGMVRVIYDYGYEFDPDNFPNQTTAYENAYPGDPVILYNPWREDYRLEGWYNEGGDKVGDGGDNYTIPADTVAGTEITFTASWLDKFILFRGGGGKFEGKEELLVENMGEDFETPEFTRANYFLAFWEDSENKEYYLPGELDVSELDDQTTLHALWARDRECCIIYNGAGGMQDDGWTFAWNTCKVGGDVDFRDQGFVKEDGGFLGWKITDPDTLAAQYEGRTFYNTDVEVEEFGLGKGDTMVVEALWANTDDCVKITYDLVYDDPVEVYYPRGRTVRLLNAWRDGYQMQGWYDNGAFVGRAGREFRAREDAAFTARWAETGQYYMRFQGGNNSLTPGNEPFIITPSATEYLFPVETTLPGADSFVNDYGEVLIGWGYDAVDENADEDYITKYYEAGATVALPESSNNNSLEFSGVWADPDRTAFVYLLNGGYNRQSNDYILDEARAYNNYTLMNWEDIDYNRIEREEHVFDAWRIGSERYEPGAELLPQEPGVTYIEAVWSHEDECYYITVDPYPEDDKNNYEDRFTVIPGHSIILPEPREIEDEDDFYAAYQAKVFLGWYDEDDERAGGIGDIYTPEDPVTLKGKWDDAVGKNIYYGNGGYFNSADYVLDYVLKDKADDGDDTIVAANSFAKTGYYFVGWNTKADGGGLWYLPGDEVTLAADERLVLYAQWQQDGLGYAVLEGKGGNFGRARPRMVALADNENYVGLSDYRATLENKAFQRWTMGATGGGRSFSANNNIYMDDFANMTLTLYAQWSVPAAQHKIRYYYDYTADPADYYDVFVDQGSSTELRSVDADDAIFLGWYDAAEGGERKGGAYDPFTPESDIDLYAHWKDLGPKEVGFDGNGGLTTDTNPGQPYSLATFPNVTLPDKNDFAKDGYFLAYWRDLNTNKYYLPGAEAVFSRNAVLHAQWRETRFSCVIFDMTGYTTGSNYDVWVTQASTWYFNNVDFSRDMRNPDYILDGWRLGDKEYKLTDSMPLTKGSTVMLTPRWKSDAEYYRISFDPRYPGAPELEDIFVDPGSYGELPDPGERDNYYFLGWFTAPSGGKWVGGAETSWLPEGDNTKDITLYAQWQVLPAERLLLHGNGGQDSQRRGLLLYDTVDSSGNITIPDSGPFNRAGEYIAAWCDDENGYGNWYAPGQEVKASDQLYLYALWQDNGKGVVFLHGNGGAYAPSYWDESYEDYGLLLGSYYNPFSVNDWKKQDETTNEYVRLSGWKDGDNTVYSPVYTSSDIFGDDDPGEVSLHLDAQWDAPDENDGIFTVTVHTNDDDQPDQVLHFYPDEFSQDSAGKSFVYLNIDQGWQRNYLFTGFYDGRGEDAAYVCWDNGLCPVVMDEGEPEDISIYAHWTLRPDDYYLYLGNGGYWEDSGNVKHYYDLEGYYRGEVPEEITIRDAFEREGYHFLCWQGSRNQCLDPGEVLSTATLYFGEFTAQWYIEENGAVKYNANGEDAYWVDNNNANIKQKNMYTENLPYMPGLRDNYTCMKPGHYLTGWNTKMDGSGESFEFGEEISGDDMAKYANDKKLLTLYAQWEAYPTDKLYIHFQAKGGTVYNGSDYVSTFVDSSVGIIPFNNSDDMPDFIHDNAFLRGYEVKNDSGLFKYAAGTAFTVNESSEISAIWSEEYDRNLYYYGNGGTRSDGSDLVVRDMSSCSDLQLYSPDHVLDGENEPDFFTKEDSIFVGWNTKPDGEGDFYNSGANLERDYFEGQELYAQWQGLEGAQVLNLTLDPNFVGETPQRITYVSGQSLTLPTPTLPRRYQSEFFFDGWYDSRSGGNLVGNGGTLYVGDRDYTLYARWRPVSAGINAQLSVNTFNDELGTGEMEYKITMTIDTSALGGGGQAPLTARLLIAFYNEDNEQVGAPREVVAPIKSGRLIPLDASIITEAEISRAKIFILKGDGSLWPLFDAWDTSIK